MGVIAVSVGVLGSVSKYLNAYAQHDKKFSLRVIVVKAIVGGFVAVLTYQLVGGLNQNVAIFLVGVSGWMGGDAMDFYSEKLKKKIDAFVKS